MTGRDGVPGETLRIVISAYPRSGATWLVSLLGDALGLDKRDIYVSDGYPYPNVRRFPWYKGAANLGLTDRCVIKSHEPPNSVLIPFDARVVHLIRDGRDVVVSKFFYESSHCVKNGIYEAFNEPFDTYLPRVAGEWATFVRQWETRPVPSVRYEELLEDPAGQLRRLIAEVGLAASPEAIAAAVYDNTRDRLRRKLDRAFDHNEFVRKGVRGDWRNHLQSEHVRSFKIAAGDLLVALGYEEDLIWR